MNGVKDDKTRQKQLAAFISGLNLLQTLLLGLTTGKYAMTRFQLDCDKTSVGIFINMTHNAMELANIIGITLIFIYIISYGKHMKTISIFTSWLLCAVNVALLLIFISGGEEGYATLYYWTLVLSAFVYGLNQISFMKTYPDGVLFATAGVSLTSVMVFIFHSVFLVISNFLKISDLSCLLIPSQISIIIILSANSAILWTVTFYDETETHDRVNEEFDIKSSWSPILMCVLSLSILYVFYPAIAPYKITSLRVGYIIQLISVVLDPSPSIIVCVLTIFDMGPNKRWEGVNARWNFAWLVGPTYVMSAVLFLITLHYPGSAISETIKSQPIVAGFLVLLFNISRQTLKSVGAGGAGLQGKDNKSNGKVIGFTLLISLFTMVVLSFIGDGYLKTYSKYEHDLDNWPTKGLGMIDSFLFWLGSGIKAGFQSLRESFTSDITRNFARSSNVVIRSITYNREGSCN
ncbi:hypothetical protein BEWA_027820 [Theileria equi strain WA]|uniref:Uncharacterized protein n=1 Tax=Theileria equi strain WA TaxID=1537102 RepID=L0AXH6_THEEQ|nr:hypothetical protein BEWA_027820 [Theileria equi strain WA]AFZ79933.1 hypothetical protein BEWA_027820 [Theileria equi strain WA]|eukprot:XP_004829599.1 hypothetical protein BEWA_027820 [Theileria equi strain WA]